MPIDIFGHVSLRCSQCDVSEDDTEDWEEFEWPGLTDFTVICADGEEGYANITQYLCARCFGPVRDGLVALGFKDHRHGSINFLEDEDCCLDGDAYHNCPTPSEYGNYVVRKKRGN